jgi:glutaredoxin
VFVTRPGCHLCEDAQAVLDRIGEPYTVWALDGDRELEAEYGDRVPVVILDGEEHGYWRVEEERLRRDLAQPRR